MILMQLSRSAGSMSSSCNCSGMTCNDVQVLFGFHHVDDFFDQVLCAIQEYKEYHTDTEVHFQLFFTAAKLQEILSGTGPHQKLKLVGKASIGEAACLSGYCAVTDHSPAASS